MGSLALALALAGLGTDAHAVEGCTSLAEGALTDSKGEPLQAGWDQWGYNYAENAFSGTYLTLMRGDRRYERFADVQLEMRWNDAWLSSQDCDKDGVLDRRAGAKSYRGTDAELITRKWRDYTDDFGASCRWEQYTVFRAAPVDAFVKNGMWTKNGRVLGPKVWGQFVVTDEFIEDSCGHDVTDTGFY